MGKLLENQSKVLIEEAGVLVPKNFKALSVNEACEKAKLLGFPVVLKALVPVGKRGKSGAIKFAKNEEEVKDMAEQLLSMEVRNYPVKELLVEEKIDIQEEWYLSITLDKGKRAPVIIASLKGGIDVEELSRVEPEKVVIKHIDPLFGLAEYEAKQIWAELGLKGQIILQATRTLVNLYRVFIEKDAVLLEINPLVLTKNRQVMAAASVMNVDDNALYRHPELKSMVQLGSERAWRPLTELEKQIVEVNEADPYRGTARYTEMDDGNIGFLCGGGGGSLLAFDAIVSCGGKPANYSEVGGNPPEQKVYGITKGILAKPGVKGLFVAHNITNNTQVDVMAEGVVRALKDMGKDPAIFPVVVREAGVNDIAASDIFKKAGIEYYGEDATITKAAQRIVERVMSLDLVEEECK